MLARKYGLPVKQFVIFLGSKMPKMPLQLESDRLNFSFPLVSFSEIDFQIFLRSDKPEEIILGILANFKGAEPEKALKQIIHRIEETTEGDLALKKYFAQLRVLSQLRKLEQKLKEIVMDSIGKYIDEKRDVAFLEGREVEQIKFVTYLLNENEKTVEQIADIADVGVEFVKSIKNKLGSK